METQEFDAFKKIVDEYFTSYLNNNFDSLHHKIEEINECIVSKNGHTNQTKLFILYLNLLIENKTFVNTFTKNPDNTNTIVEKIKLLESEILDKNIEVENLLFFNPELLILSLYFEKTDDFLFPKSIPKNLKPQFFTYYIKKNTNAQTIYFLYDVCEHVYYCEYVGKIMPINNKLFNGVYDYHLPIFKMTESCTDYNICLTNDLNTIKNQNYIYVHTIEHIYQFFEKHGKDFQETLPKKVYEDINTSKALLIYNSAQEGLTISDFYWQIQSAIKKQFNEKAMNNICFLSGNEFEKKSVIKYNKGKIIPSAKLSSVLKNLWFSNHLKLKLNLYAFRYFEYCIAFQYKKHYGDYTYEQKLDALQNNDFKTYLCFNGHKKEFRYALCFLLWEQKLIAQGSISLRKMNSIDECSKPHKKEIINEILLKDKSKFESFVTQLPFKADKSNLYFNYWYQVDIGLVNNTFLWLITETTFGGQFYNFSFSFLTEKTYKPIALFMPFIIIGDRHTLKTLKAEGYKTFSKWWSEAYDEILNQKDRLIEIVKIIRFVCSKSKPEQLKMYEEMKEILLHNHHHLLNRNAASLPIKKIVENYDRL